MNMGAPVGCVVGRLLKMFDADFPNSDIDFEELLKTFPLSIDR
jgi:hypothetical protein